MHIEVVQDMIKTLEVQWGTAQTIEVVMVII